MKKLFTAAGLFLGLLTSSAANAHYQDVVYDGHGGIVRSGFNDCVRTVWHTHTDKCHCKKHVPCDFMGMDERIVYFDFDKSNLKNSEKSKLDVLAHVIKEHNIKAVKIVGYTDRIGTHKYNDVLSRKRANEVKRYLDHKVKLDSSVVELRALGESNQVKACEGVHGRKELIECLAPNRRAEVEVDYLEHR